MARRTDAPLIVPNGGMPWTAPITRQAVDAVA